MKLIGFSASQVEESRKQHGANTLTQIPPDPLWKKILEGFKNPKASKNPPQNPKNSENTYKNLEP